MHAHRVERALRLHELARLRQLAVIDVRLERAGTEVEDANGLARKALVAKPLQVRQRLTPVHVGIIETRQCIAGAATQAVEVRKRRRAQGAGESQQLRCRERREQPAQARSPPQSRAGDAADQAQKRQHGQHIADPDRRALMPSA
jgi:hypothetical protein